MIRKTVKYTDFDDNEVTETFEFNLTKAELTELNFLEDGSDLATVLGAMADGSTNVRQVLEILKDILTKAVGKKSDDGKLFEKNDRIRAELFATNAYSELLYELIDSPQKAADFMTGLLPKDIRSEYKKAVNTDDFDNLTPEQMRERLKAVSAKPKPVQ